MAIIAGGALRFEQYLSRRSLWLDEALLANNIVDRGFGGLLDPLSGDQGAPVLFLWLERAAVLVGGNNEYALRVLPLVAGVTLLPIVYALGRRVSSPIAGAAATVLVALSPAMVRYSTEVKQYAVDATLVTLTMLLAVASLERRRALAPLAVAGAIGVWMSHPAALALAGIGPVLLVTALQRRDWRAVRMLGLIGVVWGLSIAGAYVVSLRDLRSSDVLSVYWQAGFPPRPASLDGWATWMWRAGEGFLDDPGRFFAGGLVTVLVVAGGYRVAHGADGVAKLAIVVAPFAVAVAAALAHAYPFRGRLVLFVVPAVLVLAGSAISSGRLASLGVVGLVVVTGPWWPNAARVARTPPELVESRPVFEHVAANLEPGDVVIVHDLAAVPAHFYGPIVGLRADVRTMWLPDVDCSAPPAPHRPLETVMGTRAWLVFAYTLSSRPRDEVDLVRAEMDRIAQRVATFDKADASATLYTLDLRPDERAVPSELGCLVIKPISPAGSRGR